MKYCLVALMVVLSSVVVYGQTTEDSVKKVISGFFSAMKNVDTLMMKTSFTDSAILQSVVDKDGKVSIKTEALKDFIRLIGRLPKGAPDEQIQFDIIRIDGALAMAWTPYKFYYKGTLMHCGVDSYQLVRINGDWKIQYLIDTRRKTGCE